MKRQMLYISIFLAAVCGRSSGQRILERAEIMDLLQSLADEPRETWISSGVIEARHVEYRSDTEQILESSVTVRYDGQRFYWQIELEGEDSQLRSAGNALGEAVDTRWNKSRVFAWDGKRFTMYFRPGNHASVYEDTKDIPVAVKGPLTAGVVRWGSGRLAPSALRDSELKAVEVQQGDRKVIDLNIRQGGTEMHFVLAPEKGHSVLSCMVRDGRSMVVQTMDGYRAAGGSWVPETVFVERYNDSRQPTELLSYDHWHLLSVSTRTPGAGAFAVDIEQGGLVEEYNGISERPLAYYMNRAANTEALRKLRLEMIVAGESEQASCAAVTARYIMKQAGKEMTKPQWSALGGDGKGSSLQAIKNVLTEAGLHCRAVHTDIEGLRNAVDCRILLHLPERKHFVVLDRVDESRVWLIDLDHDRFYYPLDIERFGLDWTQGTALLVSGKSAPSTTEAMEEIGETELRELTGADSFGRYSCTQVIQRHRILHCTSGFGGLPCWGQYTVWHHRRGCELDELGGGCWSTEMPASAFAQCIEDPWYPGTCETSAQWVIRYMRACE